jgi:maltose alpha-D-glucosyltransferase / alpha-amylase
MDELLPFAKKLYRDKAEIILKELIAYKKTLRITEKPFPNDNWYKYITLYFIYPDSIPGYKETPIVRLIPELTRIKELGCNAVHILPFLDSPMVDKGFDVSNFMRIRRNLGTIPDLRKLIHEAEKLGLKVFMDLVFNHISDQHEWFKKAESGDEKYRHYFIHQKTKPTYRRKFHKASAVWAEYIINGKKRAVNIAFPEYTGEIAHWREGKDGYWYYHTYYPQQLDVNWKNPNVFLEFAKIIMYWGSLGFNFRLDAIPFVGKSAYKDVDDNSDFTRTLLASFDCIAKSVDPESVFIVETYEKEETVIDYFGTTNTRQARLGYNFHLCTFLWVALVKRNANFIWEKLQRLQKIPNHAEWINFLRNHDELSLAYLSGPLLGSVKKKLMKNGAPFREGYGISGRAFSLLDSDEKRYINAYILLASMPGGMLIPYGDEFGRENIPIDDLSDSERHDTRNINRGYLTKNEKSSVKGKKIYAKMKELLTTRQQLREYLNIWPKRIDTENEVFAAYYGKGSSRLVVLINLSPKSKKITFDPSGFTPLLKHEQVKLAEDYVHLSPFAAVWLQK